MTKLSGAERKINASISVFEARSQGSDKNIGRGRSDHLRESVVAQKHGPEF